MAAFVFTNPKTGIKYTGPDASARWAAYVQGQPFADKGSARPLPLPEPPVGTYDPAIDYNAGASQRGYDQTRDDASTSYEQGQQDYGLGLGDLTTGRDRTLASLLTGENRTREDFGLARDDSRRQYGILGNQQAEHAAQSGVTSQGLLGKADAVRVGNMDRDQGRLELGLNRNLEDISKGRNVAQEDFARGKLGLDLGNARTFGGFQGNTILNPITGQPQVGSVVTGLTRALQGNNAFQDFSSGQRADQAAAIGYTPPVAPAPNATLTQDFLRRQKARPAPPKGLIS